MSKVLFTIVFLSQVAFAKDVVIRCDQKVYDRIYEQILRESIKDNGKWSMHNRNVLIKFLRELCNGQLSTLEYKNTYPKKGQYNVQNN